MKKLFAIVLLALAASSAAVADDRGPAVSIELRDVELKDVLRAIGQEHRINVVIDDAVAGKVTVSLKNVPLWDAIESILRGKGYTYIAEGNIVRIVKADEDGDLVTRIIKIKYGNPKDLEPVVRKALSKKGDLASDLRTNALVIKDMPSYVAMAEKILREVDVRTRQVMIEAKIVEVNTNATRELGIQWGTVFNRGDFHIFGGATKEKSTDADAIALTGGIGTLGSAFNVNLPAAVGPGAGGAIGLGILSKNLILDLQLSALEDNGNARILSSPKVMVSDNQEATIAAGTQIIIRNDTSTTVVNTGSTSASSVGVTEKEAALRLIVLPRIIDDEQVSLKIHTKKEEFDFTREVLDIPPKNSREAQTSLIVKNGETIVIGGIYEENEFDSENGIPGLSKIPLLGRLFKKESARKNKTELLIFLTPTIKADNP
jgi:type IV pilus assembly protein PilQ